MSGTAQLFRPQAVHAVATDSEYKDALKVMRPALWGAGLFVTALTIAAVVWSAFFTIPVSVAGQGIILAREGIVDVVANAGGQVQDLSVGTGDMVTAGMVVAKVSQPDTALNLAIAEGERADARKFLEQLVDFHARDIASREEARAGRTRTLRERVQAMSERRDALSTQRKDIDRLVESGVVPRDRLMSINQEILLTSGQISDAENELGTMAANAAIEATTEQRERLEAERRVTEAERKVASLKEQLARMEAVRSPFTGRVVEAKANVGQMVQPGTPVIAIERQKPGEASAGRVVVAYVGAADGKKISVGMPVEISPTTTRREEHGFIRGKVTHVSDVPASSAGMFRALQNDRLVQTFLQTLGAPFEVTVALETDPADPSRFLWSSQRADPPAIDSGTMVEVRITTRATSLLSLAVPALKYLGPDAEDSSR